MNWEAIGAIGEILGAIAVLVTLVYLAAQIRQNSRFVRAATYHSTSRARNEFNFAVATTPELSALLVRARDDSTSFDAEERQRFNSLMWGFWNLFEDSFFQRANGLLTRESWQSARWGHGGNAQFACYSGLGAAQRVGLHTGFSGGNRQPRLGRGGLSPPPESPDKEGLYK